MEAIIGGLGEVGEEGVGHSVAVRPHGASLVEASRKSGGRSSDGVLRPTYPAVGRDGHVREEGEVVALAEAVEVRVAGVDAAEERARGGVVGPDLLLVQPSG